MCGFLWHTIGLVWNGSRPGSRVLIFGADSDGSGRSNGLFSIHHGGDAVRAGAAADQRRPRGLRAGGPPTPSSRLAPYSPVSAAVGPAAPWGALAGRSNSFITTTKNTGTKKIARTVAEIIPPSTPVPMAFWLAALAPVAIASGSTPKLKASEVMMIGRKRSRAASMVASSRGLASARKIGRAHV